DAVSLAAERRVPRAVEEERDAARRGRGDAAVCALEVEAVAAAQVRQERQRAVGGRDGRVLAGDVAVVSSVVHKERHGERAREQVLREARGAVALQRQEASRAGAA